MSTNIDNITDTVRRISSEIQSGQERANSFVEQFQVTVTPKAEDEKRQLKILKAWMDQGERAPVLISFLSYARQRIEGGKR